MSSREAAIAARRFGLGPKSGDLAGIGKDPRGYVLASIADPKAALVDGPELKPSHTLFVATREVQLAAQAARRKVDAKAKSPVAAAPSMDTTAPGSMAVEAPRPGQIPRQVLIQETSARLTRAITTDTPFMERLVMFWSNHFCVSASKGPVMRALAGAFEREAIRPHILSRFRDMLKAVEQHPAMLIYLDNQISIGPNSKAGQRRGRGLNENLAREILELHTLGVDGGYTQADVTNFAKVITGWTLGRVEAPAERAGRFVFADVLNEPGRFQVLGKMYGGEGVASGEQVLADLARHPATARHIARKFARHFTGDNAPASLIAKLEDSFKSTGGDLGALARTLVGASESWDMPPQKVVPPWDFVVGVHRGFGIEARAPQVIGLVAALGQPIWQVPSPKGWPDADNSWMGPAAVRERLRTAERVAREIPGSADPRAVVQELLGDGASEHTRQAIARANSREQGFELLVMAPEFQRR